VGTFRQAREANRLGKEWARLYDLPTAYRPHEPEARRAIDDPKEALHHLADIANSVGLTAGDAGVLGVEVVAHVDRDRNPQAAITEVVKDVFSGRIRTVAGRPMNEYISLTGASVVAATALSMARPEAAIEYERMDPGMKRLRAYVELLEGRPRSDATQEVPPTAQNIGAGVWNSPAGPEVVRVLHDAGADRFYFDTGKNYVYGVNVGGYGRRELATLYVTGKLSLSRDRLFMVSPSDAMEAAVITNKHGEPVLAAFEWEDGLDPLTADPAFHADELPT